MKINIDFKPLLRTKGHSIFKYKKDGLYLFIRGQWTNIELEPSDVVLYGLTNMLDEDIPQSMKFDIEEAIEYLKDNQLLKQRL